jgi:hypothetical protein
MNLTLAMAATVLGSMDSGVVVRVNQVGYLPDAPKIAVACSVADADSAPRRFTVRRVGGATVLGPVTARASGSFGPCKSTWRLNFTPVRASGRYVIEFPGAPAVNVRVGRDVYAGGADTALHNMRRQRSGVSQFFRD